MNNTIDKIKDDSTEMEINEFILCEEITGALLITGSWGCGKTHMLQQFIKGYKKSHPEYMVVMVSLFGIDSIATLTNKIKKKVYFPTLENKNIKNISNIITNSIKSINNITGPIKNFLSINLYDFVDIEKKSILSNNKELVLVFDDLERIDKNLNISTVMGAMNEYIENKQIKTIIIADEEKIETEEYKEFKEKIISKTIKLNNHQLDIITNIIYNYKSKIKDYSKFLADSKKKILQIFQESEHNNLRTLKSMLVDFERVYRTLSPQNDSVKKALPDLLYVFGIYYFEHRMNHLKFDDGYYIEGLNGKSRTISDKYLSYRSRFEINTLIDWIYKEEWDQKAIVEEINDKFRDGSSIKPEQKVLKYEFFELEDSDVESGLSFWVEKANSDDQLSIKDINDEELTCEKLLDIINIINTTREYEFMIPELNYDKILEKLHYLKSKIKNGDIENFHFSRYIFDSYLVEDTKVKPILQELKNINKYSDECNAKLNFIKYIKNENNYTLSDIGMLKLNIFDDNLLEVFKKAYENASNQKKHEFLIFLMHIQFSKDPKDIEKTRNNFHKLSNFLETLNEKEKGKITKVINRDFQKQIDDRFRF